MAGVRILPVLFNTEMTRAILEDRKTATRRVAFPNKDFHEFPRPDNPDAWWFRGRMYRSFDDALCSPQGVMSLCKYRPGDVLYVRETWAETANYATNPPSNIFIYKADYPDYPNCAKWRPSIHMPREAARIFLWVTDVRVERLQEIECIATEGITMIPADNDRDPRFYFIQLWDSTVKPADRGKYGWAANPWVWVIRFERCEKPEGWLR